MRGKKREHRGRMLAGSMTVELTLLMPMVIGVFLFVFFTLYYLHDIAAIQKGCAAALVRGSLERDEQKAREEMLHALDEIRLLGVWQLQKNASVQKEKVSVSVGGGMKANEGLLKKLIPGMYRYETQGMAERIDEVSYIRKRRR